MPFVIVTVGTLPENPPPAKFALPPVTLMALIDSGHLAGATLDVFRVEPLPKDHPFWQHPKINITPHTSARTLRSESIAQIAFKIDALERGESVAGVVDPYRGY